MIAACIGASVKGIHAQREFCYQAGRGNWVYFYLALLRVPPAQMSAEREREVTFAGVPTLLVLRKTISYLSTKSPDLSN